MVYYGLMHVPARYFSFFTYFQPVLDGVRLDRARQAFIS